MGYSMKYLHISVIHVALGEMLFKVKNLLKVHKI